MRKLMVFLCCLLLIGCKTITNTQEVVRDVYHNSTDTLRDSIYNEVFVDRYVKGDTVFQVRTEYKCKYKYKASTDTLLKRDTVYVTKTIEKESSVAETAGNGLATIGLIAVAILIGYLLFRLYKAKV